MGLVVDIHTHMLNREWLDLLKRYGAPRYSVAQVDAGVEAVHKDGAPFMTLTPGMFDYELRIRNMDRARVDLAVVSLTCPNAYWGGPEISLKAARIVNDDMATAQRRYPERIRWFASLPWQHRDLALQELGRACDAGAVGVMVLANIGGRSLTDPAFADVWKAIDDRRLPVLVHPTDPPGAGEMDMADHNLIPPIGFTFDTSLALARCIYDGFLDRYPNLKLIASHGGGALPYLVGRLDICHERRPRAHAGAPEQLYAPRVRRHRRVHTGSARDVREGVRTRQRAVRIRLSAQHRRHDRMPGSRGQSSGRDSPPGSRRQCGANLRAWLNWRQNE